jgi:phosphoribosylamine--glycine ligase
VRFCRDRKIDLVVVGPEVPLVAGIADDLNAAGVAVFGPSREAARLEGSKGYTKALCAEAGIPTAAWARFEDADAARAHAEAQGAPLVVKADGLAAGKGVTVAATLPEALAAIDDCFAGLHGAAGASVIIEECLEGEEASFFVLSDGAVALPLATAQDHKRVGDGDTGPNTGGMGAYSPAPAMAPALVARTIDEIILPTLATMAARGAPFRGVLYAGLMLTGDGPKLIEYNVRFGDPETQALLMRLESDLLPLLMASASGSLLDVPEPVWSDGAALTVVMAARGYPGAYAKGEVIRGIDRADAMADVKVLSPRRSGAPTRRSTSSTGRTASRGATSAGGRWPPRQPEPRPPAIPSPRRSRRPRHGRRRDPGSRTRSCRRGPRRRPPLPRRP